MTLVSGATPLFKLIAVKTRIRVQISRRTSRQSGGEGIPRILPEADNPKHRPCNGKNERSSCSRICARQSLGHTIRARGLEGTFILIEFRSSAAGMFHAQSEPRQTASVASRLLLNMAG